MRAAILAAGIGYRLGGGALQPPKSLLRFGGRSLLARHVELLAACGVTEITIGVGYRADAIRAELERLDAPVQIDTVFNPDFEEGNVVTLWRLREALLRGGPVVLMDADVLYDRRLLERLVASRREATFLLDRDVEEGDEPVKLCVRGGRIVEFRKQVPADLDYDFHGESVGFFRLSEAVAARLAARADAYVREGRRGEYYEEALRDLLLADGGETFGYEDVTGLPWLEIDFPQDVRRAQEEVLPRLLR